MDTSWGKTAVGSLSLRLDEDLEAGGGDEAEAGGEA